jgi:hypothetical protein
VDSREHRSTYESTKCTCGYVRARKMHVCAHNNTYAHPCGHTSTYVCSVIASFLQVPPLRVTRTGTRHRRLMTWKQRCTVGDLLRRDATKRIRHLIH